MDPQDLEEQTSRISFWKKRTIDSHLMTNHNSDCSSPAGNVFKPPVLLVLYTPSLNEIPQSAEPKIEILESQEPELEQYQSPSRTNKNSIDKLLQFTSLMDSITLIEDSQITYH